MYCVFTQTLLFFVKEITLKVQVSGGREKVCNHN